MQIDTSREVNYLIKSNTGIYTFRWNIRADNKHYQPKLSLRTRNYLKALQSASELALRISAISNPSFDDVKAVYYDFSGKKKRETKTIISIDMENLLSELSIKSRKEYLSCWNIFLDSLSSKAFSVTSLNQAHIDKWKETQTCSDVILRKS